MRHNTSWLEKLETGNIENIINEIKAINLSNSTNGNALLVQSLLKINQECTGKISKKNIKLLSTIIFQICDEITELTSKLKDKFLRIMYFLIQQFFQENSYEEILLLTKFIFPTWLPLSPVEEHLQNTYNSLSILYLNYTNSYMLKNFESKHHFQTIENLILNVLELKIYANLTDTLGVVEVACQFYKKIIYCRQHNHLKFESIDGSLLKILEFLLKNYRIQFNTTNTTNISELIFQMHYIAFITLTENCLEYRTQLNQYMILFKKIFIKFGLAEFGDCIEKIYAIIITFCNFNQLKLVTLKRIQKCLETCLETLPDKILDQNLYLICSFIDSMYKKQFSDEISLNSQTLIQLLDVLLLLATVQSTRTYGNCKICSSCKSSSSVVISTNVLLIILKLGLPFASKITSEDQLRTKLKTTFELVQKNIDNLKNSICSSWEAYLINCSLNYFNTCIKFTIKDSDTLDMVRQLSNALLKYFICDFKNRQLFMQILQKSLSYLAVIYSELQNDMASREILVLLAVLFKDIQYIKFWINIKQTDIENPVTMVDILRDNSKNLRELYPKFDFNETVLIDVALLELKLYNEVWSIRKPMMKILKFLLNNTAVDWKIRAKAFQLCCQIGISMDGTELWTHLELVIENVCSQIQQLPKKRSAEIIELSLILVNLNFLKYVSVINQKRETNINIMLTATHKSINRSAGESFCWNIEKEHDILKHINETMNILVNVLENNELDDSLRRQLTDNKIPDIVRIVPYIYQLHNYPLKAIQTAILCYNIFEQLEHFTLQINMITFLLEQPISNDLFVDLIAKANKLLEHVDDFNQKRQFELLLLLGQSQYLYNVKEYRTGYDLLLSVEKNYEECGLKNKLIEARVDMLRVQYLTLPCQVQIEGHENLLVIATQIMEFLIASFKKISKNHVLASDMYTLLCYLFNFTEWIGTLYLNLYLPREAKCYSRNVANLGFYLNLPLRYIQILCVQCNADLIYTKMDNYYVKLMEILELLSLRDTTKKLTLNKKMADKIIDRERIHNIEADPLLDSALNNSEIIETEIPQDKDNFCSITDQILGHSKTCKCCYCININCQRILYEITLMEGANFYKSITNSEFDIMGKELLINNFKERQQDILKNFKFPKFFNSNITNILNLLSFEKILSALFCKYALKCSSELYLRNNYDEALKIINRLYTLLEDNTEQHSYLISEILELNCTILFTLKTETTCENIQKTPERIKIISTRSTAEQSSPDIINSTFEVPTSFLTPSVGRMNKFFKSRTPGITPAPPKFKIYTPIIEKKTLPKRNNETNTKDIKSSPNSHDIDRLYTPYKLSPEPSMETNAKKPIKPKSNAKKKLLTVPKESPKGKSKNTATSIPKPAEKSRVVRSRYKRIYTLESSDS